MKKLFVKQYVPLDDDTIYRYKVTKAVNTTSWKIGQSLSQAELKDIVELNIAEVTIQ